MIINIYGEFYICDIGVSDSGQRDGQRSDVCNYDTRRSRATDFPLRHDWGQHGLLYYSTIIHIFLSDAHLKPVLKCSMRYVML